MEERPQPFHAESFARVWLRVTFHEAVGIEQQGPAGLEVEVGDLPRRVSDGHPVLEQAQRRPERRLRLAGRPVRQHEWPMMPGQHQREPVAGRVHPGAADGGEHGAVGHVAAQEAVESPQQVQWRHAREGQRAPRGAQGRAQGGGVRAVAADVADHQGECTVLELGGAHEVAADGHARLAWDVAVSHVQTLVGDRHARQQALLQPLVQGGGLILCHLGLVLRRPAAGEFDGDAASRSAISAKAPRSRRRSRSATRPAANAITIHTTTVSAAASRRNGRSGSATAK